MSPIDRILPLDIFREEASSAMQLSSPLSEADLQIILTCLSRDKRALVYDAKVSDQFDVLSGTHNSALDS